MIISSHMSYFPEFAQPYLKNLYARNLWIVLLGRGKKKGKSWALFLAADVEVWLLKKAAVTMAVEASVLRWLPGFWVTEAPCASAASLSSLTPASLPQSIHHLSAAFLKTTPYIRVCLSVCFHVYFFFK